MSLEKASTPFHQATTVSASLQRRLRLLQVVLPPCTSAAAQAYSSAKRFSSARAFWTDFLSSCLLMDMGSWRFDKLNDQHDELVRRLLQHLEQIISPDQIAVAEWFKSSPFPRLESLRECINANTLDAEDILVGNLTRPSTSHDRDEVLHTLKELASALKDDSKQPLPQAAHLISKPQPILSPLLHSLLSTISKYWQCKCSKPHSAMLLLFSHVASPSELGSHCFTVFLSRRKQANLWRETGFTVREEIRVRIVLPESMSPSNKHDECIGRSNIVTDLCETIETTSASRLNFDIEGTSIVELAPSDQELENFETGDPVSLADGLLNHATELNFDGKLCLALVLSYSLLHYCGESWFPRGWTKGGIHFVQDKDHLHLRPVLLTDVTSSKTHHHNHSLPDSLHFLLHSILLMEIFKQAPIHVVSSFHSSIDIDRLSAIARQEFDNINWGVYERFRQSVEACMDGRERIMTQHEVDPAQQHATYFYQRVINPLEMDFASLWGGRNPDRVLGELKLPSIKYRTRPPPPPQPKPLHLKAFPYRYLHSKLSKPPLPTTSKPSIAPRIQFFDCSHILDDRQIQGANEWFNIFDQPMIREKLPKRAEKKEDRIKIAILDTGIDLNNAAISSKRGRIQCWPSKEECQDKDGHGTQVAHLFLRLASHAQLRVAKVSDSRLLQDANIKAIAKAIEHFSSDDGDRVDIINLSFGFPRFQERLRPILTAIRTARGKGVIIFAAAGNEGGNQGVSWPAKLYETSDVIGVNASDSNGNASGFNPNVGSRHRICTLGEAVPSCETDGSNRIIHRSGTSFATPIAAAIAAIVLGFVDDTGSLAVPDDFLDLKRRLRTRAGMERVLVKTCVLQEGGKRDGYSYITPWFFIAIEEQDRVGIIANELRNLPE